MLSFQQNVSKLIDIVFLFMINHGVRVQSSKTSFTKMGSLFRYRMPPWSEIKFLGDHTPVLGEFITAVEQTF